jgi:hypothetical protein
MRPDYAQAIAWIVHNRGGGGGHRRDLEIARISGWIIVRFVADLFGKHPNAVAADIIDLNASVEDGRL